MGQGAEDADVAADMAGMLYGPNFYGTSKKRKSPVRFTSSEPAKAKKKNADRKVHRPATGTEARDLILRLNHFEWETHKVSGRFDRNPYTLTATIDGQAHRIKLPGRFGGVLKWLDREERKRHVQEVL